MIKNLVLGDSLEVLIDHRGKTPGKLGTDFVEVGVPVASAILVKDGRVDLTEARYVDDATWQRWMAVPTRRGDVLLTSEAPLGRVGLVESDEPLVLGQRLYGLRGKQGVLDSRYLFYALQTERVQSDLVGRSTGTTVLGIRQSALRQVVIPAPHVDEQRAIAEVLGALDDKIAANAKAIELADQLSRAHFRAAAADGGEVPLSSLARFVNGKAFTKGATGTGRVVVRIAELNSGIGGSTVRNDIQVPDDNTVRPGDLLFAWSGSLTAARWYRPEAIVNQHIFKVIPTESLPMWLVNQAVHAKLEEFKAIAADKATTMGHIQRRHLDDPVRVPGDVDVKRLDELMNGLWETALALEMESLKLTTTRDELLPLLMSGKVRVKGAEKTLEGVL